MHGLQNILKAYVWLEKCGEPHLFVNSVSEEWFKQTSFKLLVRFAVKTCKILCIHCSSGSALHVS
jgi:hypothetical protein